jgi:hypothetical protein
MLVLLLFVVLAVYALLGRWSRNERAQLVSAEEQSRQPMILLSAHQLFTRVDMVWSVDRIN